MSFVFLLVLGPDAPGRHLVVVVRRRYGLIVLR